MKSIHIDISEKIIRIECGHCGHQFIESMDELVTKGIIYCPKCNKEYLLTVNLGNNG